MFSLVPPNNGSGPLWSYGCTQIARLGDTLYVSAMETGEDVPLLCNTRWRLLRFTGNTWEAIAEDERYRQREPAPIAVLSPDRLVLNVNDSLEPPGTKYGRCQPLLRAFKQGNAYYEQRVLEPEWDGSPYFTDHSYRGFASDPEHGRLLMLNIDANTSVQHTCLITADNETVATGSVAFPVRGCYPQVSLRDYAVYILAIGDIVEPVEEWRQYKFEQTGRQWDYVFRRLFFTWTPDLRETPFAEPVEIDNVDDTCGHITNQDLYVAPDGEAWVLYTRQEVQNELMRDRFFPGKSVLNALHLARLQDGKVVRREVLIPERPDAAPSQAKFHVTPEGFLYAVLHLTGEAGGNKLMRLYPDEPEKILIPIPLEHNMHWFCLTTTRAGNAPSALIDFFGSSGSDSIYRHATIRLAPNEREEE